MFGCDCQLMIIYQEIRDRISHGWMLLAVAERVISDPRWRKALPGGLGHSGDFTGTGELAELNTRETEAANVRTRTTTEGAAIADAHLGGIAGKLLELLLRGEELFVGGRRIGDNGLQLGTLGSELGGEVDALLIALDGGSFRHGETGS